MISCKSVKKRVESVNMRRKARLALDRQSVTKRGISCKSVRKRVQSVHKCRKVMLALHIQIVTLAGKKCKKASNWRHVGGCFAGSRQTHAFSLFLPPVSLVILQIFYCSKRAKSAKKCEKSATKFFLSCRSVRTCGACNSCMHAEYIFIVAGFRKG